MPNGPRRGLDFIALKLNDSLTKRAEIQVKNPSKKFGFFFHNK